MTYKWNHATNYRNIYKSCHEYIKSDIPSVRAALMQIMSLRFACGRQLWRIMLRATRKHRQLWFLICRDSTNRFIWAVNRITKMASSSSSLILSGFCCPDWSKWCVKMKIRSNWQVWTQCCICLSSLLKEMLWVCVSQVSEMSVQVWRIRVTVNLTGTLNVLNCCNNQIDMWHVVWETQPSYLVRHGHFV
jgi:hypothetical protein